MTWYAWAWIGLAYVLGLIVGWIAHVVCARIDLAAVPAYFPTARPRPQTPILCHVREVQYENGTIERLHSRCGGDAVDLDAMLTADALIVKDTTHLYAS